MTDAPFMRLMNERPDADEDLSNLAEDPAIWQSWPYGTRSALVRRNPTAPDRFIAVVPLLFTWAIIGGPIDDVRSGHDPDQRWCYHDVNAAVAAAYAWDGTGDPDGWHRHPASGRRRDPDGTERIAP